MSFFAQLLAGAASGVGKGMVDQADYNDKLAAQQALLQEKQANALQLQQQRADDRLFQVQTMAALKGAGGGSDGGDVFARLQAAKTPEEQQRQLGVISALGGDDAAYLAQEKILGRAPTAEQPADFVGLPGQADIGPDAKVLERVTYDREKGAQALQRVYALLANKGQTKGHAEGEAQYFTNDARAAAIGQELKRGKTLVEASETGARVADPAEFAKNKVESDKARNAAERNGLQRDLAAARRDAADAKAGVKSAADLDKLIVDYEKLKQDAINAADREAYSAYILDLRAQKKALSGTPPAQPKPAQWSATVSQPQSGKLPTLDQLRAKHAAR